MLSRVAEMIQLELIQGKHTSKCNRHYESSALLTSVPASNTSSISYRTSSQKSTHQESLVNFDSINKFGSISSISRDLMIGQEIEYYDPHIKAMTTGKILKFSRTRMAGNSKVHGRGKRAATSRKTLIYVA